MPYQSKRSLLFLAGTILVSIAYAGYFYATHGVRLAAQPEDRVLWAWAILLYIPAQILLRILIVIAMAVAYKLSTGETTVEVEDEMDRLVDLKATSVCFGVFVVGLIASLATQAAGMPFGFLFLGIGASLVASSLVGDCASLFLYGRGV